MNSEPVSGWLKKRMSQTRAWKLFGVAARLLTGLAVLFVTFWVAYGVIWFISFSFYPLTHTVRLLLAAGFVTLVVITGVKQNWEELDPLQQQARLAKDMDITLDPDGYYGMSLTTNAVKAGAFEVRTLASVGAYVVGGGPRLLLGAVRSWREFRRLSAIDIEGCAQVLALLAAEGAKQSFTELVQKLPGLNPVKTFEDLHHIDGVLYLASEPRGLTLRPELRAELLDVLLGRKA